MTHNQPDNAALLAENAALRQRLAELESKSTKLDVLLSTSEDLVMIIDEQGHYLDVAPTRSPLAAADTKSFLGMSMHELLPAAVADQCVAAIRRAIDSRQTVSLEYALPMPAEQLWFAATITPISDTTVLWVARDITKQQRLTGVEAELGYFKVLAENTPDGVSLARADGTLFYANPSYRTLTGHGDALLGKSILEVYSEPKEELEAAIRQALAEGLWQGTLTLEARGGASIPCQVSLVALAGSDEDTKVLASTTRDLTPLRQAEEERLNLQAQVIDAQQLSLRELSTPLMPLSDGVIAMPLIGTIDHVRAQQVMERLLEGITTLQAKTAILDITGVKTVDTQVADSLLKVAQAARLLGAQVILTGIGPDIAQSLVHLEADFRGVVTLGTLQSGIAYALKQR